MQSLRLARWGSPILPLLPSRQYCPLSRRIASHNPRFISCSKPDFTKTAPSLERRRGRPPKAKESSLAATASAVPPSESPAALDAINQDVSSTVLPSQVDPEVAKDTIASFESPTSTVKLPSPPVEAATSSAKLSALHARLSLPPRLQIQTLARCLVDRSADPDPRFNNDSIAILGKDVLKYYITEHLICHYPRLPSVVLAAAIEAYVGKRALSVVAREWGIEVAAAPGGEVDPGFLQFRRTDVAHETSTLSSSQKRSSTRLNANRGTTLENAAAQFVCALVGALYLSSGAQTTHTFFSQHFLSRQLDLGSLFTFREPTRDLSRLCAREGFDRPVARILSETGRLSKSPAFVVGVFSGRDKLGESVGPSLNEARARAAIKALKGWYLYSPGEEIMVPSEMEGARNTGKKWKPPLIDPGEIIV